MTVSAERAVQRALVAALAGTPDVTGVFEGPPPRAAFPYLSIATGTVSDWSTKTATGREVRVAVNISDDGDTPARFHGILAEVEARAATLAGEVDGWRIASTVFLRSLVARDTAGPWSGLVEVRIRLLQL